MKRNFTNENFEDFLRESADGIRMRPSEKVWKGISAHLNRRRRRFGFALLAFLLISGSLGYYVVESTTAPAAPVAGKEHEGSQNTTAAPLQNQEQLSDITPAIENQARTTPTGGENRPRLRAIPGGLSGLPFDGRAFTGETVSGEGQPGEDFVATVVDSYEESPADPSVQTTAAAVANPLSAYPMTIESVVNSFKGRKGKKIGFQFYFTPTISYRKLSENKSFLRNGPASSPLYRAAASNDVNNVVTHKPNIGFEIGFAAKYPIAKKIKLRAGLQFNVNRYALKGYNANTSVATIMLNSSNNMADSLNTVSSISNVAGHDADWLENFYFQVAAPVGAEFILNKNEKVQFGIATTVQPTYMFSERAYVISTDYKSYAEVPNLTRKWNVNTSLETFVSYSTGRLSWQVGPQVRYQLLSSYVSKYPVKENLFDFGLRIGLSVNQ